MFSQSAELSQSSNGDYNFLHNSQNSSQFEFDGIQNKATNIFGVGDLGTINEENPISPIKLNFKDESKKSLLNQDISKNTKYSFTNNNNNINSINIPQRINPNSNNKTPMQKTTSSITNKENINTNNNIDISNNNMGTNSKVNITLGEVKQGENNFFNFDSYKCQLSQQIDQVEKIAMQSMNPSDNANNSKVNNNYLNEGFANNINEEELLEHQKFNQYCSELIDQAMNKNLDYIDNIKKEFVTSLDLYKNKFRTNAEIIKKLILLYSDDVFQKEKNKIIISHLADQLLSHINSFFQEMSKFNNFNLSLNSNCGGNNSIISNQNP
jgi:hypothetical protein